MQTTKLNHKLTDSEETGPVKVSFVPTKDNVADICTKPLDGSTFSNFARLSLFRKPKCLEQAQKKEEGWFVKGWMVEGE